MKRTTILLDAVADRHCHMERSVNKAASGHGGLWRRLEVLEGKFATASFSTSSTRTTDGGARALPRTLQ